MLLRYPLFALLFRCRSGLRRILVVLARHLFLSLPLISLQSGVMDAGKRAPQ